MILVDANLLLYAEDSTSERHCAAREWWDARLSGSALIGLCWPVMECMPSRSHNRGQRFAIGSGDDQMLMHEFPPSSTRAISPSPKPPTPVAL